ncbi:MAG TPA: lipoprotein [Stellaceae bacterium]|nr:lipoprotein [Stellaceae bacterium]
MNQDNPSDHNSGRRARALRIVVVLLVALALAGCGRKGAPQPPSDEPTTYPRPYPRA